MSRAWLDDPDDPDRMTPDDLLTVTFPLSRRGHRGYEEDPVREFLGEVHDEFMRLVKERTGLWQEIQRLRGRIISGNTHGDPQTVLFGDADPHVHAARILSTAQVTADRYVADAKAYSSRLTEEAKQRREEIMQEAQQYADMVLEDAHAQAREAAVSALNAAPTPQSEAERQAAQAELAYLRTYSDVYRTHLRAYTEGILRGIEEWERNEAAWIQEAVSGGSSPQAIDSSAYLPH